MTRISDEQLAELQRLINAAMVGCDTQARAAVNTPICRCDACNAGRRYGNLGLNALPALVAELIRWRSVPDRLRSYVGGQSAYAAGIHAAADSAQHIGEGRDGD